MRSLSILGSTGSIGKSTLDVVARHPERFRVVGLAEGHDVGLLARQIEQFRPALVSVRDEASADQLRGLLGSHRPEITFGIDGACQVARHDEANMVVSAIVGAAGLLPTIAAIKAGKMVALANKETMVVAGELVSRLASERGATIIPIDSEHSAIFQSMVGHRRQDVVRLVLTASGGPFLRATRQEMEQATLKKALAHPRWSMGAKITIDSASLMNKGLEVIEARWLFDIPPQRIDVVVHPQSIIHSMVEYCDGCVMAQLGVPDMRAPIAYAITYPERTTSGVERLDLSKIATLTFEEPDRGRFPCLGLAYAALKAGGTMPAAMNAANEVAVASFLEERIGFLDIPRIVEGTMSAHDPRRVTEVDDLVEIDRWARGFAREIVGS
jgi:1-deoxy-D-xylulose-5-phosphate reductoisomerase